MPDNEVAEFRQSKGEKMVGKARESLLSPYRALDLTDEKGFLCGKILGDLGADVIKIEAPLGDPARNIGPFYRDIADPEKSLSWFAYNTSKRGITLNLHTADGRDIFKRLVETADFVIESFAPGHMEKLGLGYQDLNQINSKVIMTSITPFGQNGPYKDYKASDLVVLAMGGYLYLCGDADRPPVRISLDQAYAHAAVEAATGTIIALYYRESSGEGQHVDVSAQECCMSMLYNAKPFWFLNQKILKREGHFWLGVSGQVQQMIWPCRDGAVTFFIIGGKSGARTNQALVDWMDSEGMADGFLRSIHWESLDMVKVSQEFLIRIGESLKGFFAKHTASELYEGALKRRLMLYPLSTIKDLIENAQLAARKYWVKVEHLELGGGFFYPGAFVKLSETPIDIKRRAPLIGEHNVEIYNEIGISKKELTALKQANVI